MDSELVNVAVPRTRLLEVYRLLAEQGSAPVAPSESAEGDAPLDPNLVERAYRESPDSMKSFLRYLAERPEQRVPNDEIADAMAISRQQLAGVLGAFGRRWINRYRQPREGRWPMGAEWQPKEGSDAWRWHYWVTRDVADAIRKAAAEGA